MIRKRKFVQALLILVFAVSSYAASDKPNILIIFTDDQGYADLGCYGSEKHKTPRLNQLASEGTRFTSFYSQNVCGPARSALLTGRYPIRSKGWSMPAGEITWAEVMQEAGYETVCIGKWDVSNRKAIIDRMPNAQGFDYFWGALGANDNGIIKFHVNNEDAGSTTDMASLTRLYTDKAIDYLQNRRDRTKPFVLYLAHTMMHVNIDASPEFKGRSEGGLYGDVVEEFDYETGRLLDKLDKLGLSENTLVIYTTDNGPWCQEKYILEKTGQMVWTNNRKPSYFHKKDEIFWGDPGPLRGGKGSAYEAGSRVPCIVRWPGKVPAGKTSDALWATIDFLPTFLSMAGVESPNDRIIDGIDQTAMLTGQTNKGRDNYIYDHNTKQGVGVRNSKWKMLVAGREPEMEHRFLMDFGTNGMELYDLNNDVGEENNVADKHPEIVVRLQKQLDEFLETTN
jgi:arylsulfatase A-like enzyme